MKYIYIHKIYFKISSLINPFNLGAPWCSGLGVTVTRNRTVVSSSPIKGSGYILKQETLPSLLSTGWFQEQI